MENAPVVTVVPEQEQQHQQHQRLLALAPWKRSSDACEDTLRSKWTKRPSSGSVEEDGWRWTRRLSTGATASSNANSGETDERTRWTRRLSTTNANTNGFDVVHPTFKSDVAARAYLGRQRASSARRAILDTDGLSLRLVTARAGGDCGFEAVCWGLQTGRGYGPTAHELRRITRDHVMENRNLYARACGECPKEVDAFCRSVIRPGLSGHWLGSSWGEMELIAVSRAVGVSLKVYTFDVKYQRFRSYFQEIISNSIHPPIRLLFTGDAERGHFDCLVPEKKSLIPALWRRRFVRKIEARTINVCGSAI